MTKQELLLEMYWILIGGGYRPLKPDAFDAKIASMSCKAAVKGNLKLSLSADMDQLIDELLSLDNPYNCPHGRPTIISMTNAGTGKEI